MHITKYHGTGNDFVMLADLDGRLGSAGSMSTELIRGLCHRHTGIGADGLIRVMADAGTAGYMDYYNADGSSAEMCGNGVRCLVAHEIDSGRLAKGGGHAVATKAGVVSVETVGHGSIRVGMGRPKVDKLRQVDGYTGVSVSMGNPHFVVFDESVDRVQEIGPALATAPEFPDGTNVELVAVESATRLRMRVWERGVGETLSCGSGACAAAVASAALEKTGPTVIVAVPGGELEIEWDDTVYLTGPAERVFEADIDDAWLAARGLAPVHV